MSSTAAASITGNGCANGRMPIACNGMTEIEMTDVSVSQERSRTAQFASLFFLSGFSALIYQTAWQRMLGLFSGSDAVSVSIVVSAFLLGLGVGSLVASLIADRMTTKTAVKLFALCELGIAAFALTSKLFFYDLLFERLTPLSGDRMLVFVMAFLGLLAPTLLMGLSLPLLAKATTRNVEAAPTSIAWLYVANTLGAGVGAFVSGFVLIGTFGYVPTILFAAAISAMVGVGAMTIGVSSVQSRPFQERQSHRLFQARDSALLWQWSALVFASGFVVIALELVWFRVIAFTLANTAYSFSLVLGAFLIADAGGVAIGIAVIDRFRSPRRAFLLVQAVLAVLAVLSLFLLMLAFESGMFPSARAHISHFYRADPLSTASLVTVFAIPFLVIAPAALLAGLSVPIAQKAVQNDLAEVGRRTAVIQGANILGNVAGGLLTGLVLFELIGVTGTIRLIACVGAIFAAAGFTSGGARKTFWLTLACALGIAVAFPGNARFLPSLLEVKGPVIAADDRTGVAVLNYTSPTNGFLFVTGKWQSRVPFAPGHVAIGLLGPILHPHPKSVLVIGYGTGGTAFGAGVMPGIERVHVVEINAAIYRVMRDFVSGGGGAATNVPFDDRRYELSVGDARHALSIDPRRYDVIQQDPLEPHDSYSGLLYSVEYFRQLRDRLNPDGLCVQHVPRPRIEAAFLAVFPYVVEVGGRMVGSNQPIDVARLQSFKDSPPLSELAAVGISGADLLDQFKPGRVWTPSDARPTDFDSDLFPKDEFYLNTRKIE